MRQYERKFYREKVLKLEELNSKNPREFWEQIRKIGLSKSCEIPMTVKLEDSICSDEEVVLNKWHDDFHNLLNIPENSNFDDVFKNNIVYHKEEIESQMKSNNYRPNEYLNAPIELYEIENMVTKLKSQKAVGIDKIPNEILKNPKILEHLHKLFQALFERGMLPSQWKMAIITPIPKSSDKDPLVPLNYRGIFSSILNRRIVSYCEELEVLVEEQIGFRAKRSCEDHIFSLTSIIRNHISCKKPVFVLLLILRKPLIGWIETFYFMHC